MAKSKNDISAGFDITFELDKDTIKNALSIKVFGTDELGEKLSAEATNNIWSDIYQQVDSGSKKLVDQAEEIFHEEAAMSHWSLNMADNSIDKFYSSSNSGTLITVDARVGVNKYKIGDTNNWQTYTISKGKNKGKTGYFYKSKSYRMYPGRDYSVDANDYAMFIAGFVERSEERFDNL